VCFAELGYYEAHLLLSTLLSLLGNNGKATSANEKE
jgi:hypothetical protein